MRYELGLYLTALLLCIYSLRLSIRFHCRINVFPEVAPCIQNRKMQSANSTQPTCKIHHRVNNAKSPLCVVPSLEVS